MQQIIMILNYAKYLNAMHVTTVESFFFFFLFKFNLCQETLCVQGQFVS